MDLDGAAFDGTANDFLELRFEEVVWFGGAERDLEITIVDGAQFDAQVEEVALIAGLAVARHTEEHAYLR
jgi:hypothetical protein